jgi:uncharacterized protein (DUF58 family)
MMKTWFRKYIGDLFLTGRFYGLFAVLAVLFLLRFFVSALGMLPVILLVAGIVFVALDYMLLFASGRGKVTGQRDCPVRLSNGDENTVTVTLRNHYGFNIHTEVIDEIPFQFQKRDARFQLELPAGAERNISYTLRPVKRGTYGFGKVRVYAMSRLGCIQRRFIVAEDRGCRCILPSCSYANIN